MHPDCIFGCIRGSIFAGFYAHVFGATLMLHLRVHPLNPQQRHIERAVDILRGQGGICVYPTDTVYGMGAAVSNAKAIDRIGRFLEKDKSRTFSFICSGFSQISQYARVNTRNFRILKHYLPGPYTFILPATNYVPKRVCPKRKTVGVRIPDCPTVEMLVGMLGEPLANTSIKLAGQLRGDPEEVRPAVLHEVDVMLDVGVLEDPRGSTIVDLTGDEPEVIREGKGAFDG
jgi:tRNA threonylcarbamoyl adenosine modification protein (Sua5/YciO/YrdC/YwlC family)